MSYLMYKEYWFWNINILNQYWRILYSRSFCTLSVCLLRGLPLGLCKCRWFCSWCLSLRCRIDSIVFQNLPSSTLRLDLHRRTSLEEGNHRVILKFPFCYKTIHRCSGNVGDEFELFSNNFISFAGRPWGRVLRLSFAARINLKLGVLIQSLRVFV